MRTRSGSALFLGLAFGFGALLLTTPDASAQGATAAAGAGSNGLSQALLDTLAARLADLELRRADIVAGNSPDSPERRALEQYAAILQQQLSALPNPRAAQTFALTLALRAVEARLAHVTVERRLLEGTQSSVESPTARAMAAIEGVLQQRRLELQRLLAGSGTPPRD